VSAIPGGSPTIALPWSGVGYVHVEPDGGDRFDIVGLTRQPDGRWNDPDDRTLYLAGDPGVALSELARHLPPDGLRAERRLLRVEVRLERVLDLRSPQICERLGVSGAPFCFLEREQARDVAGRLRRETDVEAILVPPMAFLDDPERWNLIGFADRMGANWLAGWSRVGTLELRAVDDG
jgi:RES domain-containing protein